jgi:hypothetical protein
MLERLNVFIGSLVLSLMIVFGVMYAAVGNWKPEDLGIRTASTAEPAPAQQQPAAPVTQ